MIEIAEKCCGCGSCARICSRNCITMKSDDEGFRYPLVDVSKCIRCGNCEKVCPILHTPKVSKQTVAIAAQNKNEKIRMKSSSGGVFHALAMAVLANGGKVCAATYDKEFFVFHEIADTEEQLTAMCGAKYLQSEADQCFEVIKNNLQEKIYILFVGTPCQCAGLKNYLNKEYENLLLVDMICHGVPSSAVWKAYLQERHRIDAPKSRMVSVNLRSKTSGWSNYKYSINLTYENGKSYEVLQEESAFLRGFTANLYLRPSCGYCSFKGAARCSDLTLGDYWGVWNQYPDLDDNKGTSLLFVQSEKGVAAWEQISDLFVSKEVSLKESINENVSVTKPSLPHPQRAIFFKKLKKKKSLEKWIWKCILPKEKRLIKRVARILIGKE